MDNLSAIEMMKRKTSLCKELVAEFLQVLPQDRGLLAMRGDARNKPLLANRKINTVELLSDGLETTKDPQELAWLLVELKQAEKEWDALHEYEVFKDEGDKQYKCIRAQDYVDQLSDSLFQVLCVRALRLLQQVMEAGAPQMVVLLGLYKVVSGRGPRACP